MAEVLENYEFNGRNRKYRWDDWLDGQVWKLTSPVDFTVKYSSMRAIVAIEAKRRGLKIRSRVEDNALVIQAYKKEG